LGLRLGQSSIRFHEAPHAVVLDDLVRIHTIEHIRADVNRSLWIARMPVASTLGQESRELRIVEAAVAVSDGFSLRRFRRWSKEAVAAQEGCPGDDAQRPHYG